MLLPIALVSQLFGPFGGIKIGGRSSRPPAEREA